MSKNTKRGVFLLAVCLLLATACTPNGETLLPDSQSGYPGLTSTAAGQSESNQEVTNNLDRSNNPTMAVTDDAQNLEVPSNGDPVIIELPYPGQTSAITASSTDAGEPGPGSTEEDSQAVSNPTESEDGNMGDPGFGENGPGVGVEEPILESEIAEWIIYANDSYNFSINYPSNYQYRLLDEGSTATSDPRSVFAIDFISQESLKSDVAELEIPEMSIRVYPAGSVAILSEWLAAGEPDPAATGQNASIYATQFQDGLQICSSTTIVPNCSIFFYNNDLVWRLVPSDPVGEAMAQTFRILQ